jgi:hypothetical protein
MADPVLAGSDVSAGSYRCTDCGYELGRLYQEPAAVSGLFKRLVAPGDRRGRRPVTPQAISKSGRITKRRVGWL